MHNIVKRLVHMRIDPAKIRIAPYSRVFEFTKSGGRKLSVTVKDAQFYGDMLLDDTIVDDMVCDVCRAVESAATKYNPLPRSIVIAHGEDSKAEQSNVSDIAGADIIRSFAPRWTMSDVCVDEPTKSQVLSALAIIGNRDKLYKTGGLARYSKAIGA